MYPLGFTGLIECRILNIFAPGVCPVWIMCFVFEKSVLNIVVLCQKVLLVDTMSKKGERGS